MLARTAIGLPIAKRIPKAGFVAFSFGVPS